MLRANRHAMDRLGPAGRARRAAVVDAETPGRNDPRALGALIATLTRAGLLTEGGAGAVTQLATDKGSTELDALLELGLCDEDGLVVFLHRRMMIPRVTTEMLRRLDLDTVGQIPADLAWEHSMLAVSIDDANNLTLAMADPTDVRAVAAAANHTGAYLIRAVAPAGPLREAIYRYLGPRPPVRRVPATPRETPMVEIADTPSTALPLSPSAYAQLLPRLVNAADRDDIIGAVLDFLGAGFVHVIVFLHLQQQLRGRDARGPELLRDAVSQVRIPTTPPSVFADAIGSRMPYFGPWPTERAIDVAFAQAMGGIEGDALVLPIGLAGKVPVVIFAATARAELDPGTLAAVAHGTSSALERMIYRRKSLETPAP